MAPQTHDSCPPEGPEGSASHELATLAGLDRGVATLDRRIGASSSAVEPFDPGAAAASSRSDPAWPRVGRFELRGRLGTGAMGVVYEAHDPSLDRAVAVKVLHAEMPRAAQRRMQREALALARLSHPNVVQVFEVGEDQGRTFIAMELVRGHTLDAWGRRTPPPSWRECLAVYVQAAEGLAAAHDAGLAHRDFKPSNCILGDDGRVRVLDFGLAKALHGESRDDEEPPSTSRAPAEPELTQGTVGTPAYMAPEQLDRGDAGPAADQYSLCTSLWEALYGQRAFVGDTLAQLSFRILAGVRSEPPAGVRVPRWLRAVITRGLAIDPAQRWPSVRALLVALERGRARARRTRILAGVGVLASAVAAVAGAREYERAQRVHACEAEGASIQAVWNDDVAADVTAALEGTGLPRARVTAERVRPWLDAHAHAWQAARTEACLDARVRGTWDADTLDRAVWCLDDRRMELEALLAELGSGHPRSVDPAVRSAAGLGRLEPCRDAAALARLPTPPTDAREAVRAVRAELQRAWVLHHAVAYDEGLSQSAAALARARALEWPPVIASALAMQGLLLSDVGRFAEAEATLEDAFFTAVRADAIEEAELAAGELAVLVGSRLERHTEGLRWARYQDALVSQLPDPLGLRQARYLRASALVRHGQGEYDAVVELEQRALALEEAALGPEHPDIALTLAVIGRAHVALGQHAAAEPWLERALAVAEAALGPEHPDVGTSLNDLAMLYSDKGEFSRAKGLYERTLAIREHTQPPDHPDVAVAVGNLGTIYEALGEHGPALALYERALAIRERALGPHHTTVAGTLTNLAGVLHARGEHVRALALDERALAIVERALGPDHPMVAQHLHNLASGLQDTGQHERAKAYYARALPILEATLGAEHPVVAATLSNLALAQRETEGCEAAVPALERALAIGERVSGPEHPDLGAALGNLADCHRQAGATAAAEAEYERALRIAEAARGPDHPSLAYPLIGLGVLARDRGRLDEALERAERALRVREASETDPVLVGEARLFLAGIVWDVARERPRARALVEAAHDACQALGEPGAACAQQAAGWLRGHAP